MSECLSHREIAVLLGISHGRVQQIEAQALQKLRRAMVREGMIEGSVELPPGRRQLVEPKVGRR